MKSLVGYTGFVGSNIASETDFDGLYRSANISDAFGTNPDLLVYAGVRSEKFLANHEPEKDLQAIRTAFNNIKKISPQQLVLISTIDVYKNPVDVDEDTFIETDGLQAYGLNRYRLEQWVEESFENSLIVRLPGLYGKGLKKNFIYDFIHLIPSMLTEAKFVELCSKDPSIKPYYAKQGNGFYKCLPLSENQMAELRNYFSKIGFSALDFTDSRGFFQFYNLNFLWAHIQLALKNGLRKINLFPEPVSALEIYEAIRHTNWRNELHNPIPLYRAKTKYADLFGGHDGYIIGREFVIQDVEKFIAGKV